jgi:tetratricopeptide (TPR) repeat protein
MQRRQEIMSIHPSVLQLSKRLGYFLPVPGVIALATYLASLSHSVYPGYSAALSASAAGLIPPSNAAHPLFALAARAVASLSVFSLPVRLNLFSALCGTLCAMLLYHLVSRLILFSACEDEGGGGRNALTGTEDGVPEIQPEVALYNLRVLRIAIAGGVMAAFLLTFMAPVWSAATRLDTGLFDLLLALASLSLFPAVRGSSRLLRITASVFIFVLGLFDSAVFLVILPCYVYFTFRAFVLSSQRIVIGCWILVAVAAGGALSLYAFWRNMADPSSVTFVRLLVSYARVLPYQQYHELCLFIPKSGWMLVLLQTGVPAVILLFGQQILFKEKQVSTLLALLLVTFAITPGLLNLSFAPLFFFQPISHLPVFGSAILAAAAAAAFSACRVFIGPEDRSPEEGEFGKSKSALKKEQRLLILRRLAGGLLTILLLLALATPWRSFSAVDARQGAFADRVAQELLAVMKGRDWLISNGHIDNHLLIQAFMRGKPLVLVPLRPQDPPQERAQLKGLIAASPVFAGQNRQRLQNALSIGTVRFVMEWLTTDRKAGSRVMVLALPDIWTACGYRAVPEGLAFGGVLPDQKLDLASLAKENRMFSERVVPLLAGWGEEPRYSAALRETLRMRAGFAANEMGVLFEEAREFEAAYQAYSRAGQIDPMNISAAINGYALAATQKMHPEALDRLRKNINTMTANGRYEGQGNTWILQNYGTIRLPAFYQQQAAMWSSIGARAVSTEKIRKALALSEQTGASALVENAMVYLHTGDSAKAESCYLAALHKDASNKEALSGICTMMLSKQNTLEAEKWLQKGLEAGIAKDALLYQTVMLAILKRDTAKALKLLKEATEKHPTDLRYWTLQAELMLNQGDAEIVEHTILPEMQKALKTPNHFLIHAIRGFLLRNKGPAYFKEARLSLLKAVALNAAMPDLWSAVFELDGALKTPEFTEADARSLLRTDPDHARANYLMGSSLLARGKVLEAEDFLRRSIEKDPTAEACNDLGENLRLQKKLAEAERFARQALAIDPGLPPALDTLACIQFDAGKVAESAQAAAKAVAAKPKNPAYQLTLLRAQVRLGDKEGVRQRRTILAETQTVIPAALQKEMNEMK